MVLISNSQGPTQEKPARRLGLTQNEELELEPRSRSLLRRQTINGPSYRKTSALQFKNPRTANAKSTNSVQERPLATIRVTVSTYLTIAQQSTSQRTAQPTYRPAKLLETHNVPQCCRV